MENEYEFDIVEVNEIDGGIEVFARVFRDGQQLGFGRDGSVDIERFRIFNPPVLVDDPNGDIVREWQEEDLITGETVTKTRTLQEDPAQAILESLSHTISVMKNVHSAENIVVGKRGNTTSTFYPEASPETTTFDGYVMYNSTAISWASIIAQTSGNTIDDASTELLPFYVRSGGGTNWNRFARSMVLFDTSTIPDTDIISSATLSISATLKRDDASVGYDLSIYEAMPASNTAIASGDFDNFGTTNLATTKSYADLTATGYNDWVLNASGIATISKTGVSKFGWRSPTYDVGGTDPGSATLNQLSDFRGYSADQTGTSNDPKLVVEHSAPTATFIPRIIMY